MRVWHLAGLKRGNLNNHAPLEVFTITKTFSKIDAMDRFENHTGWLFLFQTGAIKSLRYCHL